MSNSKFTKAQLMRVLVLVVLLASTFLLAAPASAAPPSLMVTKTGPATISASWVINYKITVSNRTGAPATIYVVDTLPSGPRFISADHGGVRTGDKVRWTLTNVASGASVVLQVRLGTISSYSSYEVTNKVRATSGPYTASSRWKTTVMANK